MASGGGKPPSAPDPNTIIPLQSQYNRWNASGPFGSQTWSSGGPGGHETLNTTLSPQMQGVTNRAFQMAGQAGTPEYVPQGMGQLASAVLGKVGGKYGLSGSGLNTDMTQQKPQGMSPPAPNGMGAMGGRPMQMPQMGPMQGMPGSGSGTGQLGGFMGGGGGFGGGSAQSAMTALMGMQGGQPQPTMPPLQMNAPPPPGTTPSTMGF